MILTARLWSKPTGQRTPKPYRYPRPNERRRPKTKPTTSSLDKIRRFFGGS